MMPDAAARMASLPAEKLSNAETCQQNVDLDRLAPINAQTYPQVLCTKHLLKTP